MRLLAQLFLSPRQNGGARSQGLFRASAAEVWRLGQQRRSQFLAALLKRKRDAPAVHMSQRIPGRTDLHGGPERQKTAVDDVDLRYVA